MTGTRDWRVAVVGAGPAGLYATAALIKLGARVDVFEKEFAPFGLVRYGVAPDHQKIKRTQIVFERILEQEKVQYFGNVTFGVHVTKEELLEHYDQILFSTGSSGGRRLGIKGEELNGSVSATALVGWYNAHPSFRAVNPDLDCENAVTVGMGNVAIDVARILLRRPSELAKTDLPHYALEALSKSRIRRVTLLARRGPNQAAFDAREVRALAELDGVQLSVQGYVSKRSTKLSEFIASFPREVDPRAERQVILRFCASPTEILGKETVTSVLVERNDLVESAARMRAVGTGEVSKLAAGLVVSAIGYQASPVKGLPFDELTGTIPSEEGRVLDERNGKPEKGLYVAGWIKRGPTGLIGTNKACALSTVVTMERDLDQIGPERDDDAILKIFAQRSHRVVSWSDWKRLDEYERRVGAESGRPREKIESLTEALALLDRRS